MPPLISQLPREVSLIGGGLHLHSTGLDLMCCVPLKTKESFPCEKIQNFPPTYHLGSKTVSLSGTHDPFW